MIPMNTLWGDVKNIESENQAIGPRINRVSKSAGNNELATIP